MSRSNELQSLAERIGSAEGASIELDHLIAEAVFDHLREEDRLPSRVGWRGPDEVLVRPPAPYSASLDAAVTLAESLGRDASTMIADALENLSRYGFRGDKPFGPQLARQVVVELLTYAADDADLDRGETA